MAPSRAAPLWGHFVICNLCGWESFRPATGRVDSAFIIWRGRCRGWHGRCRGLSRKRLQVSALSEWIRLFDGPNGLINWATPPLQGRPMRHSDFRPWTRTLKLVCFIMLAGLSCNYVVCMLSGLGYSSYMTYVGDVSRWPTRQVFCFNCCMLDFRIRISDVPDTYGCTQARKAH